MEKITHTHGHPVYRTVWLSWGVRDGKVVSGGGGKEKGGHVLKDTTSRGLCVRVWHLTLLSGAGEAVVVALA